MNYSDRYVKLNTCFTPEKDTHLPEAKIDVKNFSFKSNGFDAGLKETSIHRDDIIVAENQKFRYPVFVPRGKSGADKAILLLHGLNERSWNKYLCWAEYLCEQTGKPVILFPIAFHINRSPKSWSDPRSMLSLLNLRRNHSGNDRSVSLANVALSERLSNNPLLFYTSGKQTFHDLEKLCTDIRKGMHPLFAPDAHIDLFAYSIGAFLAQVLLLANPGKLFSDSRLFLFCGGSIFSAMQGVSRSIMDRQAFERLNNFYLHDFELNATVIRDTGFGAFRSMISPERKQAEREKFFNSPASNIQGISLVNDRVIPYSGVEQALGNECASKNISLIDFPFAYSHENPFPLSVSSSNEPVNDAFNRVFSQAASFLE
ncbi:MAG: DUF6051 family protein [Paludibacteraceae bacterium]